MRCCGSVWLNGKERKEKAHVSNMYNFTMLVGIKHKTLQNIKEGKNTKQKTKEIKNTNEIFQFKGRLIDTAQFHRELH
jgi:hypothetical protein